MIRSLLCAPAVLVGGAGCDWSSKVQDVRSDWKE